MTIYDPPQEDYWYDDWGNIHISNKPPHYYSCYNFALTFANIDFDYHMPYPIGNSYFPAIRNLSKIDQEPNFDGPYMFGEESDYTEQCYAADHNLIDDIKDWIDKTAKKHNLLNLDKLCLEKSQKINQAKDAHRKEVYEKQQEEKQLKKFQFEQSVCTEHFNILLDLLNYNAHCIFEHHRDIFYTKDFKCKKYINPRHLSVKHIRAYLTQRKQTFTKELSQNLSKITKLSSYAQLIMVLVAKCSTQHIDMNNPKAIKQVINQMNLTPGDFIEQKLKEKYIKE